LLDDLEPFLGSFDVPGRGDSLGHARSHVFEAIPIVNLTCAVVEFHGYAESLKLSRDHEKAYAGANDRSGLPVEVTIDSAL
jgi:hypothetical protein